MSKLAIEDQAEKFTPNKFEFPNFERGHFVIKFSGVTPISVNMFDDHQMFKLKKFRALSSFIKCYSMIYHFLKDPYFA